MTSNYMANKMLLWKLLPKNAEGPCDQASPVESHPEVRSFPADRVELAVATGSHGRLHPPPNIPAVL